MLWGNESLAQKLSYMICRSLHKCLTYEGHYSFIAIKVSWAMRAAAGFIVNSFYCT